MPPLGHCGCLVPANAGYDPTSKLPSGLFTAKVIIHPVSTPELFMKLGICRQELPIFMSLFVFLFAD